MHYYHHTSSIIIFPADVHLKGPVKAAEPSKDFRASRSRMDTEGAPLTLQVLLGQALKAIRCRWHPSHGYDIYLRMYVTVCAHGHTHNYIMFMHYIYIYICDINAYRYLIIYHIYIYNDIDARMEHLKV